MCFRRGLNVITSNVCYNQFIILLILFSNVFTYNKLSIYLTGYFEYSRIVKDLYPYKIIDKAKGLYRL